MTTEEFLSRKFPKERIRKYYIELWENYIKTGLADPDFETELCSGDDAKFCQRAWEMIFYRFLCSQEDIKLSKFFNGGPDFSCTHNEQQIWIECTVPEPKNLPPEWLNRHDSGKSPAVPFDGMLLRWTASFKEKWEKLEGFTDRKGKQIPGYLEKGVVKKTDAYVIAIDSCRLSSVPGTEDGVSRFPFAVETVFPLGPLEITMKPDGAFGSKAHQTFRFSVPNHNNSPVRTDNFLNPAYAGISAIIGCSTLWSSVNSFHMTVVHNPLARNPIPKGLFGTSATEYEATQVDESAYDLKKWERVP